MLLKCLSDEINKQEVLVKNKQNTNALRAPPPKKTLFEINLININKIQNIK